MDFKDNHCTMGRTLEYYDKESQRLNRLSITSCDALKSGDIQIVLERMNLNENSSYGAVGIEFMWPGAVGKDVYQTYKTLWEFIQNNKKFLHKNNKYLGYNNKEILRAIRGDFKQWTCYLKITNTKNDILNVLVKWGQQNNPIEPADTEMNVNLITPEKIPLYIWDQKDIIIITQEELHRMLKIMESMEQDVKKSPEIFTARI